MKVKATKKFSELGSSGNWWGFGKVTYTDLEQGNTVESSNSNLDVLLDGGYVEEVKSNKKKESK